MFFKTNGKLFKNYQSYVSVEQRRNSELTVFNADEFLHQESERGSELREFYK